MYIFPPVLAISVALLICCLLIVFIWSRFNFFTPIGTLVIDFSVNDVITVSGNDLTLISWD